jgi:hypothetical protein
MEGSGMFHVWRVVRSSLYVGALCLIAGASAACNENPVDSGIPQVEVVMQETEFTVPPGGLNAIIGFTIANRGPGTAFFEGCPSPVGMVVEVFDNATSEWVEHDRLNSCPAGEVPQTLSLEPQQGYAYELLERDTGSYRVTVFYGSEAGATTAHSSVGPEYNIR